MKGKTQKKYGVADAVALACFILIAVSLIYFLLVLIFGGFERFKLIWEKDGKSVNLSFVLKIEGVDTTYFSAEPSGKEAVCDFISVGDDFYIDGTAVGKVTAVTYKDHKVSTGLVDTQGSVIYAAYPGVIDLFITVEAKGTDTENGYTVGGAILKSGSSLNCSTKKSEFPSQVVSIEECDDDDLIEDSTEKGVIAVGTN